jgi:hypothetical protein
MHIVSYIGGTFIFKKIFWKNYQISKFYLPRRWFAEVWDQRISWLEQIHSKSDEFTIVHIKMIHSKSDEFTIVPIKMIHSKSGEFTIVHIKMIHFIQVNHSCAHKNDSL